MKQSQRYRLFLVFSFLLIAGTVFGASVLRNIGTNIVALCVLLAVSAIPFVFVEGHVGKASPLLIWVAGFAVLFNTGQIPPITSGEKVVYAFPLVHNFWDPTLETYTHLQGRTKTLGLFLPISLQMIVPPITSISLDSLFLTIYPALFSIVPVILYKTYREYLSVTRAGLTVLFYIFFFGFYFTGGNFDTGGVLRTGLGILYLSLFVYLFSQDFTTLRSKLLAVVCIFAMTISHYGVAYLFLPVIVGAVVVKFGLRILRQFWENEYQLTRADFRDAANSLNAVTLVAMTPIIMFSWYIYTANSINLSIFVENMIRLFQSVLTLLRDSYYEQSGAQQLTTTIIWTKQLTIVFSGLMAIGVAGSILLYFDRRSQVSVQWLSAGVVSLSLGILPLFSHVGFPARFYGILFVFLSPFAILGVEYIFRVVNGIVSIRPANRNVLRLFSISIVILLLVSHGFVSETVTKDMSPVNRAISQDRIESGGDEWSQWNLHRRVTETESVESVNWLVGYKSTGNIYRGSLTHGILRKTTSFKKSYARGEVSLDNSFIINNSSSFPEENYITLTHTNVEHGFVVLTSAPGTEPERVNISTYNFDKNNKIYSNGEAVSYRT